MMQIDYDGRLERKWNTNDVSAVPMAWNEFFTRAENLRRDKGISSKLLTLHDGPVCVGIHTGGRYTRLVHVPNWGVVLPENARNETTVHYEKAGVPHAVGLADNPMPVMPAPTPERPFAMPVAPPTGPFAPPPPAGWVPSPGAPVAPMAPPMAPPMPVDPNAWRKPPAGCEHYTVILASFGDVRDALTWLSGEALRLAIEKRFDIVLWCYKYIENEQ